MVIESAFFSCLVMKHRLQDMIFKNDNLSDVLFLIDYESEKIISALKSNQKTITWTI